MDLKASNSSETFESHERVFMKHIQLSFYILLGAQLVEQPFDPKNPGNPLTKRGS